MQDQLIKANTEQARLQKTLVSSREAAEAYKTEVEKHAQAIEELKAKHETDMAQARRTTAGLQRDKSDLLGELNHERQRRVSARGRISHSLSASPGMLSPNHVDSDEDDVFAAGGKGNSSPTKRGPGFDANDNALSPSQLYESDFDSPNPTPSKPFPRSPLGEMFVNENDELREKLRAAEQEIEALKSENERVRLGSLSKKESVNEFGIRAPAGEWEEDEHTIGASSRGRGSTRGRRGGRGKNFAASIGRKFGFNRAVSGLSTPNAGERSFSSTSSGTPDLLRPRDMSASPAPSVLGGETLGNVLGSRSVERLGSASPFNTPSIDSLKANFGQPTALADEIGAPIESSTSMSTLVS